MENEDVIREQMEDTRTSLSEKLETLEKQVASTVQGATSNVAETVEAVKETVTKVTDTVQNTVDSVKESVHDSLDAVKGCFDIPALVRSHPWAMFGGSVALGFLAESLLTAPVSKHSEGHGMRIKTMLPPDHYSGEDQTPGPPPKSRISALLESFEPQIHRLKGLALGALMNSIRDKTIEAAPPHMADSLREIFNDVTTKLGGQVFSEQTTPSHTNGKHAGNGVSAM
jgi:ElaB/YqjD/DUF883 family membrane-anchored ribosome-binding protein